MQLDSPINCPVHGFCIAITTQRSGQVCPVYRAFKWALAVLGSIELRFQEVTKHMRAWELLGPDEGMEQAGSQGKNAGASAGTQKKLKQAKPKRVKPIEPESPFSLKLNKDSG